MQQDFTSTKEEQISPSSPPSLEKDRKDYIYYLLVFVVYFFIVFFTDHLPFFSDNVTLVSKPAQFYFDHNFNTLILPTDMDSGHPPFYALFVAIIWKVFDKTLLVSHWLVFPFMFFMGVAYYKLAKYFLPEALLSFALLLLFIEPCLLTQAVYANFDIVLVCFYLWALVAILYKKRVLLALALLPLAAVSLRGVIAIFLLAVCDILIYIIRQKEGNKTKLNTFIISPLQLCLPYLPVILFFVTWLYYHYVQTGFVIFNYEASWAEDYQRVGIGGFLWNTAVIIWRLFDNGRVVLYLLLIYFAYLIFIRDKQRKLSEKQIQLIILFAVPVLLYIPFIAYRTIPILHRYFIVYYLLMGLLVLQYFYLFQKPFIKKTAMLIISLVLISGHFWVYPQPIATGWDAILSSLPYFKMKDEMAQYVRNRQIPFADVGSEFPAVSAEKFTHLNNDTAHFTDSNTHPFSEHRYMMQSNLMNNFTPDVINKLETQWLLEKEIKRGFVYVRFYKNPN